MDCAKIPSPRVKGHFCRDCKAKLYVRPGGTRASAPGLVVRYRVCKNPHCPHLSVFGTPFHRKTFER